MADDPYTVIGVSRSASDEEVRRAYLKLVKELHPDVNPAKAASDRFKKVTAAYEILGDAARRRQFDRGEIDANGEARRPQQRHYAGASAGRRPGSGPEDFGFADIFSDFFGGGGPGGPQGPGGARAGARGFAQKGRDVRYTLDVEFTDAIQGTKRRVTMPEGGTLDLTVPEGVSDGQVLRLKGKGGPGTAGGEAGDALVEIRVRPHAHFKRERDDILIEAPITLDEAILGAKVEVPTVGGRVHLTIPKGTSSGTVFRLKGKGAKNAASGVAGDQLVTVRIVLPETIDESLAEFMASWREKHRYDPGRR